MRIVFMGTPDFSLPPLEILTKHHEVCAVYTRPDAVRGRGASLQASPVKLAAKSLDLPVYTPKSLHDEATLSHLKQLAPDLIVVVAYGAILPPEVLGLPSYGCLNIHASLLPRWRGAAPIQRAILAGDDKAGICIMRMEEGLDTGDVCATWSTSCAGKSLQALSDELSHAGALLLLESIDSLTKGTICWTQQENENSSYADKIDKLELRLDPSDDAITNLRRIYASNDAAPARARICGQALTLITASLLSEDESLSPGEVSLEGKRVRIGTANACLQLDTLKPDGKKAMSASAWRAGLKDAPLIWDYLQ